MLSMVCSTPGTGRAWHMDICSAAKSVNKGKGFYLNLFRIYLRKKCRALRKGTKSLLEKSLKNFKKGEVHF